MYVGVDVWGCQRVFFQQTLNILSYFHQTSQKFHLPYVWIEGISMM